jgi:Ca2+-binding RTX toxin-like protein
MTTPFVPPPLEPPPPGSPDSLDPPRPEGPSATLTLDGAGNLIATVNGDIVDDASPVLGSGPIDGKAPNTIFGGAGDDYIRGGDSGTGIAQSDFLIGDGGHDTLLGEAGDDALFGRAGDDFLAGGGGVDLMFGEAGNDRLVGGAGQDALVGGAGADVFVLTADGAGVNIEGIFDFNRSEGDKIEFRATAFQGIRTAAEAVAAQQTLVGFLDQGGLIGLTFYTMIDFGTPARPQVLLVGGNPTLLASDFVVTP